MTKLRTLLAAALITIPVLTLDAAQLPATQPGSQAQLAPSSQSVDSCCWVFFLGRWWCFPC